MKSAKLLAAVVCLLACLVPAATTWAAFECQAVCLCTSRCSTKCFDGTHETTCGGFGICADLCRAAEPKSGAADSELAQLEEELFGAEESECAATE